MAMQTSASDSVDIGLVDIREWWCIAFQVIVYRNVGQLIRQQQVSRQ